MTRTEYSIISCSFVCVKFPRFGFPKGSWRFFLGSWQFFLDFDWDTLLSRRSRQIGLARGNESRGMKIIFPPKFAHFYKSLTLFFMLNFFDGQQTEPCFEKRCNSSSSLFNRNIMIHQSSTTTTTIQTALCEVSVNRERRYKREAKEGTIYCNNTQNCSIHSC